MSANVTIMSVGDELITGDTLDTNASFLAGELTTWGFTIRRIVMVGDEPEALQQELARAAGDSAFIVLSGGLGPTADDRTRRAIASAAGKELVLDHESLEHVRHIVEAHGRRMSQAHAAQAYFPEGSVIFPNMRGTARGFACQVGKATVLTMPGVPEEMHAVFRDGVLPYLLRASDSRGLVRKVNLFGLPESAVDAQIADLTVAGRNPSVGLKVEAGVVSISLRAAAPRTGEAEQLVEQDMRTIRQRFGEAVFGYDDTSLAEALSSLFQEQGLTVAVAESCTGGLVGDLLTDVPGISRFFLLDVVAYSNEAKVSQLGVPADQIQRFGAVSAEVARSMAAGACRLSGALLGISTTGITGPSGGTPEKPVGLVYVGICLDGQTAAHELRLRGDRRRIKQHAARHALNAARLALLHRARKA